MPNESIGGISVSISVGLQDLQAQLSQAQQMSESAGKIMAEAFNAATASANQLSTAIQGVGASAGSAAGGFSELAGSLTSIGASLLTFGALKEIATDSLEAYANLQRATTALTALTGSAATADKEIADLKKLAMDDALSFPELLQANQRLTALGVNANQIPAALRASADAAAAMNTSLINVTNAIDRMAASGSVAGRNLTQLGLTTNDLAKVMGVSLDQLGKAFHNLDESDRISYLTQALGKFGGTAEAVAGTLQGSFNRLENTVTFAFQSIGESIAPAAKDLTDLAVSVIPHLASGFSSLAAPAVSVIELGSSLSVLKTQIVDTVAAIIPFGPELKAAASAAGDTKSSFLDLDPSLSAIRDGADLLTKAVHAYTDTGPEIDSMNRMVANGLRSVATAAALGGQAFQDAWNLSKIEAGLGNVDNQIHTVVQEQQKAEIAFRNSAEALNAMSAAFNAQKPLADGHIVTLGELARAQADFDAAQKKANAGSKDYQDTLAGLTAAYNKQEGTINTLQTTIGQLLSIQNRTAQQESELTEAENKLASAMKTRAAAHGTVAAAMQDQGKAYEGLTKSANDFITKEIGVGLAVNQAKAVLDQLTASEDRSAEHQRAVVDALGQYGAALKAAGGDLTKMMSITVDGTIITGKLGDIVEKARQHLADFSTAMVTVPQVVETATGRLNGMVIPLGFVNTGLDATVTILNNKAIPAIKTYTDLHPQLISGLNGAQAALAKMNDETEKSVTNAGHATNYYSSLAASISHVGEATSTSTAVNDAWNGSIVTSVDNASKFANTINQVTGALHNMATAEDQAKTAAFDADKSFKATTGSVNALSVGVAFLAMQLSGLTAFAGSGIDYSKGQSDLQHQLYLARQAAGDPTAQPANFAVSTGGALKGQTANSLSDLNQALSDLQKTTDAAATSTEKLSNATAKSTQSTLQYVDGVGNIYDSYQKMIDAIAANPNLGGLWHTIDTASSAATSLTQATQATTQAQQQFVDGLGNVYDSYQALTAAIAANPLLGGPATSSTGDKISGPSSMPSTMAEALANMSKLATPNGATGDSKIPNVLGTFNGQVITGSPGMSLSDAIALMHIGVGSGSGAVTALPGSMVTSNGTSNYTPVPSNQQGGQGIVVNMNYPSFNSQQQADQVMKQVVTQLRTVTGLKL